MSLDKFTSDGKFIMLAFDHRGSFKKLINPQNPDLVSDEAAIALKKEVIDAVRDQFSSLLIDWDFGYKAYEPKDKPFLLPLEKTGYDEQKGERFTRLEYNPDSLQAYGASGAKLLLYFNPFLKSSQAQMETAKKAIDECRRQGFPIFLEIITYEVDHEPDMGEREKLVLESLKFFVAEKIIPDVFKLEYPGSALGCQTITAILKENPWILLTRGVEFDEFVVQLKEASIRGCRGFLAGRALWQEICKLEGEEKKRFLNRTLPERFKIIADIAKTD